MVCSLASIYSIVLSLAYNKSKLYKTLNNWSRDRLNFYFLEKGLGIVFPSHFVYDFWKKIFLMLYSINWSNFIVELPFVLEILTNICIAIVCEPGCDVINLEINLVFLIKPFFYMTKKSKQKLKYIVNKKEVFKWNKKHFSSF